MGDKDGRDIWWNDFLLMEQEVWIPRLVIQMLTVYFDCNLVVSTSEPVWQCQASIEVDRQP